jgi:hypothetical protein
MSEPEKNFSRDLHGILPYSRHFQNPVFIFSGEQINNVKLLGKIDTFLDFYHFKTIAVNNFTLALRPNIVFPEISSDTSFYIISWEEHPQAEKITINIYMTMLHCFMNSDIKLSNDDNNINGIICTNNKILIWLNNSKIFEFSHLKPHIITKLKNLDVNHEKCTWLKFNDFHF